MAPIPADGDPFGNFGVSSAPTTDNLFLEAAADDSDSSTPFKTWIYVPLIAFMVIALVVVYVQFRRRRQKVVNNLMLREALARDIAALGNDINSSNAQRIYVVRSGANSRPEGTAGLSERPRPRFGGLGLRSSRWQWGIPVPSVSRRQQEEGLNELGEAPPPYDPTKAPPVPLHEAAQPNQALARIPEEEARQVPALREGTGQRNLTASDSASNTTVTNTGGPEYAVASSRSPGAGVVTNAYAPEPNAPPPVYVR